MRSLAMSVKHVLNTVRVARLLATATLVRLDSDRSQYQDLHAQSVNPVARTAWSVVPRTPV
jgi:hypothetical protein